MKTSIKEIEIKRGTESFDPGSQAARQPASQSTSQPDHLPACKPASPPPSQTTVLLASLPSGVFCAAKASPKMSLFLN